MLYSLYEAQHAWLTPWRLVAEAQRGWLTNPFMPWADAPLAKKLAASNDLFLRVTQRYDKPEWRIADAQIEVALWSFALDAMRERGFTQLNLPSLAREEAFVGTGHFPGGREDVYDLGEDDIYLSGTAEVLLNALHSGEIVPASELPLRYAGFSTCFRREAGSAGRDVRGLLRIHQFYKVELVSITTPEQSPEEHERMTKSAETVLQKLGLPYRVVVLSTGDMGFAAQKTYDIEVWLPGQGTYREISSCSNCGDFQARRMNARYRPQGAKDTRFVHTLNGSGVAVGRALIAVMENYQNADGSITVPEALRGYMGVDRIG